MNQVSGPARAGSGTGGGKKGHHKIAHAYPLSRLHQAFTCMFPRLLPLANGRCRPGRERGDRAEARRLWRMVLDACPGDAEAMSRGKRSGESGSFPPGSANPTPSVSVRSVSQGTASRAPKTKRPWIQFWWIGGPGTNRPWRQGTRTGIYCFFHTVIRSSEACWRMPLSERISSVALRASWWSKTMVSEKRSSKAMVVYLLLGVAEQLDEVAEVLDLHSADLLDHLGERVVVSLAHARAGTSAR